MTRRKDDLMTFGCCIEVMLTYFRITDFEYGSGHGYRHWGFSCEP